MLPPVTGSALVYNLATTEALAAGFITAYPAGGTRGNTANVNAIGPGTAVANLAVTATSTRGVALYSFAGEHVVVDMTGYFTGSPAGAPNAPPVNSPPADPTPPAPAGCDVQSLAALSSVRAANAVAAVADDAAAVAFACSWSAQMAASGVFGHSSNAARTAAVGVWYRRERCHGPVVGRPVRPVGQLSRALREHGQPLVHACRHRVCHRRRRLDTAPWSSSSAASGGFPPGPVSSLPLRLLTPLRRAYP